MDTMRTLELIWPEGIRLLIIDEKGMLAQVLLWYIDLRLRTLFDSDLPFGGIHIMLFGDYQQLGPVKERTLFDMTRCNDRKDSVLIYKAQELYKSFNLVVELKTNYRMRKQPGESAQECAARVANLKHQKRIAVGDCDKSDLPYWHDFMDTNVERRNEFLRNPKTIHIVTDNPTAAKHNAEFVACIRTDEAPVFSWNAWNSNTIAMRADHNDVRGLRNFIGVCAGAPILLLSNLHTAAGLTNGTRGIVRDVVFAEDSHETDVPLFVVCEFPGYTGPPFPAWADDESKKTWVPIGVETFGVRKRKTGSRTQIPIVVAKALTTWKAQGMSLDKIYVHVNTARNKHNLVYTAISRSTHPDGLLLSSFEGELFDRISKAKGMKRMLEEIANLNDLAQKTSDWVEREGIRDLFEDYLDESAYKPGRRVPVVARPRHVDSVTAAMDVTNFTGDVLGSAIGDHTFAQDCAHTSTQDCAWRRRMHKQNSKVFDLEKLLSVTPAPLGRHTTKKRKRSPKTQKPRKQFKKCHRSS